jgi:hypothetical protein
MQHSAMALKVGFKYAFTVEAPAVGSAHSIVKIEMERR